ncbi:MAG TPA: gliding motility lipoprotein GldH [Bacteroidia bacterium]|jgi:gliding motility-associated lipoprotein GldH|nr:gliding motility lipoprotein GldH [Bacteroidia bacterium]
MKDQSRKIKDNALGVILIFSILFFSSCNNNVVFSKYQSFEENEWFAKNKVTFEVNMTDINSLHDISVMIRHADGYPYSNLFVFLTTKYPDGKVTLDTLECILANAKGEWMGNGAGDIYDITIPLKQSTRFPLAGKYSFTFEQAMRTDPLPLIMDFGFEIKRSRPVN